MGQNDSKSNYFNPEFEKHLMNSINNKRQNDTDSSVESLDREKLTDNDEEVNYNDAAIDSRSAQKHSLKFHQVCGKNVNLLHNKKVAERLDSSFCDAIVFSKRPVGVYERVNIKILKLSSFWNGMIRFGFTSVNPDTFKKKPASKQFEHQNDINNNNLLIKINENMNNNQTENEIFDLPKYVYPDLTNKKGFWAGSMQENSIKENDIIYYYVNSFGEIHYGINDKYKGKFLDGIEVYNKKPQEAQPLWAIIDIYGNTLSIELITVKSKSSTLKDEKKPIDQTVSNISLLNASSGAQSSLGSTLSASGSSEGSGGYYINNSSLISNSSSSLSSSKSSNSSSNSSIITVISNHNLTPTLRRPLLPKSQTPLINNNETSSENDRFDRLLISFRRLCVDNHLNETLHNSFVDFTTSTPILNIQPHTKQQEQQKLNNVDSNLNMKIKNFYSTIPILFHENGHNSDYEYLNDSITHRNNMYRFQTQLHGKNVKVNEPDGLIAYRESSRKILRNRLSFNQENFEPSTNLPETCPTTNSYVFLNKPIEMGKSFCLQIVGVDQSVAESKMSLTIGCTTCRPDSLNPLVDLPDDSDDLMDRLEYWVVFKNLFNNNKFPQSQVSLADEICFIVNENTGDIGYFINGNLITKCLFNVDTTQKLWFFFDLCGSTNAIRLIPSCSLNTAQLLSLNSENSQQNNGKRRSRPNSALIEFYKHQLITNQTSNASQSVNIGSKETLTRKNSNNSTSSATKEECRICWDAPIECVFYSCGHMCLCWNCATNLKNKTIEKNANQSTETLTQSDSLNENENKSKPKNPLCPICRTEIIDLIKFFKS